LTETFARLRRLGGKLPLVPKALLWEA